MKQYHVDLHATIIVFAAREEDAILYATQAVGATPVLLYPTHVVTQEYVYPELYKKPDVNPASIKPAAKTNIDDDVPF